MDQNTARKNDHYQHGYDSLEQRQIVERRQNSKEIVCKGNKDNEEEASYLPLLDQHFLSSHVFSYQVALAQDVRSIDHLEHSDPVGHPQFILIKREGYAATYNHANDGVRYTSRRKYISILDCTHNRMNNAQQHELQVEQSECAQLSLIQLAFNFELEETSRSRFFVLLGLV